MKKLNAMIAALLTLADFRGKSVIDVGSGAGFPGLALKVAEPDLRLTLLDSLDKRVRFLRALCDQLGFEDVACLHARAEEAPPELRGSFERCGCLAGCVREELRPYAADYVAAALTSITETFLRSGADPEELEDTAWALLRGELFD